MISKLSPHYPGYNKLRNLLHVLGECKVWWLTFAITMVFFVGYPFGTPPSSLKDSNVNPKMKTMKGEGIGAHSLARSTFGVSGCVKVPE
jgi:hypothetical protein